MRAASSRLAADTPGSLLIAGSAAAGSEVGAITSRSAGCSVPSGSTRGPVCVADSAVTGADVMPPAKGAYALVSTSDGPTGTANASAPGSTGASAVGNMPAATAAPATAQRRTNGRRVPSRTGTLLNGCGPK